MPRTPVETFMFNPIGPYSHATMAGPHVYLSGTPGIDPATGQLAGSSAYEQAHQALSNLICIVKAAGGGEEDLVALQVQLLDVKDFAEVNRAFEALLMIVTGSSQQSLEWVAHQSDGWLTYPGATQNVMGPRRLAEKVRAWRDLIPGGGFRPHMTNEWIDLVADPSHPRTPLRGGYVLRTGRRGLVELFKEWQDAGVNHAALGLQFSTRAAAEVLDELAQEVLPHFPSHAGVVPGPGRW